MMFLFLFKNFFYLNFPKTIIIVDKRTSDCGWNSDEIVKKKRQLTELKELNRMQKTEEIGQKLKISIKELRESILTSNQTFYNGKIKNATNKTKMTWNIIKREINLNSKPNLITNINMAQNDKLITHPIAVSNILNNFFTSAVEKLILPAISSKSVHDCNIQKKTPNMSKIFKFQTITEDYLEKCVLSFENKFSS
jgi:hypothetical protein